MSAPDSSLINEQRNVMARWAACWSSHDVEPLLSLFAADATYEDVPMGAISRGTSELRAFVEKVLSDFPDITFDLVSTFTDGQRGAAEWVMRGTRYVSDTSTEGTPVKVRGVSIFEFAGNRIQRCSDYWNMATYLEQLGLPSSLRATGE